MSAYRDFKTIPTTPQEFDELVEDVLADVRSKGVEIENDDRARWAIAEHGLRLPPHVSQITVGHFTDLVIKSKANVIFYNVDQECRAKEAEKQEAAKAEMEKQKKPLTVVSTEVSSASEQPLQNA